VDLLNPTGFPVTLSEGHLKFRKQGDSRCRFGPYKIPTKQEAEPPTFPIMQTAMGSDQTQDCFQQWHT
jgi:hypothetical protein